MTEEVVCTEHGEMRVRKRAGLSKKAADRLAKAAYAKGNVKGRFSGSFRRYLDHLWHKKATKPSIRVYGGYIFIFQREGLVTMFSVPGRYRKLAERTTGAEE